jgi:uncharacterized protein YgiM (DUF1202 family)
MRPPKLDTIILVVFLVCIALWMVSKCGSRRSNYLQRTAGQDQEVEDRPVRRDTVRVPAPTPTPTTVPTATPTPTPTPQPQVQQPAPQPTLQPVSRQAAPANPGALAAAPATTTAPKPAPKPAAPAASGGKAQTMLYVTIDQLKMRKEPGLKGKSIGQLDLYEQVYFTGQRTEWTQEISLGVEKVKDRWVKVRTKDGKEGWVFGAGVNYYKEKRKGVLE